MNPSSRRLIAGLGAALVLLLHGGGMSAAVEPGAAAVPVHIATAVQTQLAPTMRLAGSVVSRNRSRIAAEVSGRLVAVADVGSRVERQGEVARTDDTSYKLKVVELRAVLQRERADQGFLEHEVARLEQLTRQNVMAKNELERTRAERDAARGEVAAARARLALGQDRLERTILRAPFAGVVTEKLRRVGERVDAGDAVVYVVDPDTLEVQARVPHASGRLLPSGAEVRVESGAESAKGRVRTLVPVGDERTGLFDLRLDLLPNSVLPQWSAGTTVRVQVPTAAPRTVVAVPRDALVLRRTGTTVFRIGADDTAERVSVTTGIAVGGLIEVEGGIEAGDRIVVQGNERLRPGQKVRVEAVAAQP